MYNTGNSSQLTIISPALKNFKFDLQLYMYIGLTACTIVDGENHLLTNVCCPYFYVFLSPFLFFISCLQCLACQHVFDVSQAFEQPSDEPQPLKSSFAGRRRSLSKLLCPFCSSPILQYSSVPRYRMLYNVATYMYVDFMHDPLCHWRRYTLSSTTRPRFP